MNTVSHRLFALLRNLTPGLLQPPAYNVALSALGLDSFALVTLLMDVEDAFSLPVEAMREHLHKRCTFGDLVRLCSTHGTDRAEAPLAA